MCSYANAERQSVIDYLCKFITPEKAFRFFISNVNDKDLISSTHQIHREIAKILIICIVFGVLLFHAKMGSATFNMQNEMSPVFLCDWRVQSARFALSWIKYWKECPHNWKPNSKFGQNFKTLRTFCLSCRHSSLHTTGDRVFLIIIVLFCLIKFVAFVSSWGSRSTQVGNRSVIIFFILCIA